MPHDFDAIASLAQLRLISRGIAGQALYLLDTAGHVMSWNTGAENLHGYTASEIIGQHFSKLFQPADQTDCLTGQILDKSPVRRTCRHSGWAIQKDGSKSCASLIADAIHDQDGNIHGFALLIRDLNEKPAKDAASQSHQCLHSLLESLSDCALYVVNRHGLVVDWNEGAAQLLGYAAGEIISQPCSKFFAAGDQAKNLLDEFFAKAREQGQFETQILCVRKDGATFFANVTAGPLKDDAREITGYAIITKNLTAKIAAEKLKKQLHQSQKMAMLGEVTTVVAHDFNNLLAAILGSLELISNAETQPLIDIAKRAANRGAKLTNQLRTFARAQTFCPLSTNLNQLIKDFELLLERAGKELIVLNLNLCPDLWPCDVDPAQFQSAILNLVWTCCDRMVNGGTVTVETKNISINASDAGKMRHISPGSYIAITVSETRPDSASETRLCSLEPGYPQEDIAYACHPRLGQVYDFARFSKGHLEFISQPGHDVSTCLFLPKSFEPELRNQDPHTGTADPAAGTVLVVDDDPDVLEVTVMKLQRLGYTVNSAKDGHAALSILRGDTPIDVLITDVRMPYGMDGIDLACEARVLRPSLHIILASGDPRPPLERVESLQDNVSFLAKPYTLSLLAEKLVMNLR